LTEEDGISLQNGFLSAPEPRQAHLLMSWLNKVRNSTLASSDEPLLMPRRSGRPSYNLRSSDIESGLDLEFGSAITLAIFLSDPDQKVLPDTGLLIKKFAFTPTEASIVLKMTMGYSVNEIALEQNISRNTVHHHLKSIFRKTNSSRQSELVATVLSLSWEPPSANRNAI
jgi:DNA-binding CsgD family transcriptional regulator